MIIHIVKDPADYQGGWDAFDENDRCIGIETTLRVFREIFGVKLHRGFHPDSSKISSTASLYRNIPGGRAYWFEKN
jgi:hypothetical protein